MKKLKTTLWLFLAAIIAHGLFWLPLIVVNLLNL